MGQSGSVCCCCGGDKRASSVQNESLQEKLLDADDHSKPTIVHGDSADPRRMSRKMSSSRDPRLTQGMMSMDVDGSEDDTSEGSRDRMDEIEDDDDVEAVKTAKRKPELSTSYRPSMNEWDISQIITNGSESTLSQQERGSSDRDYVDLDVSVGTVKHLVGDMSTRDSYASARGAVESIEEENDGEEGGRELVGTDRAQEAVLRRRSMPRPSSSKVFEEEEDSANNARGSSSRSLRELDEDRDGFGSFSSESSSMRSFLVRDSDEAASVTPIYHTQNVADGSETSSITEDGAHEIPRKLSGSPRSKSKKKGKKRR